jgi:hypothetical protein
VSATARAIRSWWSGGRSLFNSRVPLTAGAETSPAMLARRRERRSEPYFSVRPFHSDLPRLRQKF